MVKKYLRLETSSTCTCYVLFRDLKELLFRPGLGKYWKMNRSSRWHHHLTNKFPWEKKWCLSRKLMTTSEVLGINPDFRTMVVHCCVWWSSLVSNILRRLATHVEANTRLERVRRQSGHDRRHHTWLTGGQGRQPVQYPNCINIDVHCMFECERVRKSWDINLPNVWMSEWTRV